MTRVVRASAAAPTRAFTLIELLVVMAVIIVLAGLVLSISSYVQNKGARSRAEAEIAAMSAALESYKADNGIYPRGTSVAVPPNGSPNYTRAATGTDDLNARSETATQNQYQDASRYLYEQLSGDTNLDSVTETGVRSYFSFKPTMLALIRDQRQNAIGLSHIKDPFGNSYGYSTGNQGSPNAGYNPTFDLWSTSGNKESGETFATYQQRWIKNW